MVCKTIIRGFESRSHLHSDATVKGRPRLPPGPSLFRPPYAKWRYSANAAAASAITIISFSCPHAPDFALQLCIPHIIDMVLPPDAVASPMSVADPAAIT